MAARTPKPEKMLALEIWIALSFAERGNGSANSLKLADPEKSRRRYVEKRPKKIYFICFIRLPNQFHR